MYEGALFRFPAARVSSYASASRKLFSALARGTLDPLPFPPPSLSLFLSPLQFITFLTEFSVALFISDRMSAVFNPARDL